MRNYEKSRFLLNSARSMFPREVVVVVVVEKKTSTDTRTCTHAQKTKMITNETRRRFTARAPTEYLREREEVGSGRRSRAHSGACRSRRSASSTLTRIPHGGADSRTRSTDLRGAHALNGLEGRTRAQLLFIYHFYIYSYLRRELCIFERDIYC
jgi:hypothetical protein